MTSARRILIASTGSIAALSLLASPAAANPVSSLPLSPAASLSAPVLADRDALLAPAVARYHAWLDAKLDSTATALVTNRAQWAAVASTSVLTGDTRQAAASDLLWALRTSRHLAAVPSTGPWAASAAERTQITALRSGLGALAGQLRTLLGNGRPAMTSSLQANLQRIAARTSADRAQWSGVAPDTVLTGDARRAALADLVAAKRGAAFLARVDRLDLGTAAQQEAAAALGDDVAALKARLRTLLQNGDQPQQSHRFDRGRLSAGERHHHSVSHRDGRWTFHRR